MLDWEGMLTGVDGRILWRKKRIKGGRYLYAFKDMDKAHGEENGFLDRLSKENKKFEKTVFDKAADVSGTIVFEADLDADPVTIYQCYEKRWLLELVFRLLIEMLYRHFLGLVLLLYKMLNYEEYFHLKML